MSPATRRGIYTVANDKFSEWLLALFASLKILNSQIPVRVIPFDGSTDLVQRICQAFGYAIWAPSGPLSACDRIAEAVLPLSESPAFCRGAFRRFAAFCGPFEEFMYLDADTLVLEPLTPLFDACANSGKQIVFADGAGNCAYNPSARREELRTNGSQEWNTGVYYSRSGALSLDAMLAACRTDLAADYAVIRRDATDQSFLNWFIATRQLSSVRLGSTGEYGRSWAYLHQRMVELPGHLFDFSRQHPYSRPVPIVHWAGQAAPTPDMPYAHIWQAYRTAAQIIYERAGPPPY